MLYFCASVVSACLCNLCGCLIWATFVSRIHWSDVCLFLSDGVFNVQRVRVGSKWGVIKCKYLYISRCFSAGGLWFLPEAHKVSPVTAAHIQQLSHQRVCLLVYKCRFFKLSLRANRQKSHKESVIHQLKSVLLESIVFDCVNKHSPLPVWCYFS